MRACRITLGLACLSCSLMLSGVLSAEERFGLAFSTYVGGSDSENPDGIKEGQTC